jgi:hypothetical protein
MTFSRTTIVTALPMSRSFFRILASTRAPRECFPSPPTAASPRSSSVLLRNANAAEQRYTGPACGWPSSETRNDLETPDAGEVDADRFHCVGPRRRDLYLAHRRSQVEINLWRSWPHESSGNKEGPAASRGDRRFSSHGGFTVRRMWRRLRHLSFAGVCE